MTTPVRNKLFSNIQKNKEIQSHTNSEKSGTESKSLYDAM